MNFTSSVVSPVGTTLLVLRQRMRIADIWICAPDVFVPKSAQTGSRISDCSDENESDKATPPLQFLTHQIRGESP